MVTAVRCTQNLSVRGVQYATGDVVSGSALAKWPSDILRDHIQYGAVEIVSESPAGKRAGAGATK